MLFIIPTFKIVNKPMMLILYVEFIEEINVDGDKMQTRDYFVIR